MTNANEQLLKRIEQVKDEKNTAERNLLLNMREWMESKDISLLSSIQYWAKSLETHITRLRALEDSI